MIITADIQDTWFDEKVLPPLPTEVAVPQPFLTTPPKEFPPPPPSISTISTISTPLLPYESVVRPPPPSIDYSQLPWRPALNFVNSTQSRKGSNAWTIDTTLLHWARSRSGSSSPTSPASTSPHIHPKPKRNVLRKDKTSEHLEEIEFLGRLALPNLKLSSPHGKLDIHVRIINGTRLLEPALMSFHAAWGVKVAVHSRKSQRIHIVAASNHSGIEIAIPRDFVGLVHHRTKHKTLVLSDEVKARSTLFSAQNGCGKTFIGDWTTLNLAQSPANDGEDLTQGYSTILEELDSLVLNAEWGIKISYADE